MFVIHISNERTNKYFSPTLYFSVFIVANLLGNGISCTCCSAVCGDLYVTVYKS